MWQPNKTVFVQIGDSILRNEITRWANNRGFDVFFGSGCDLIAVGCLFAIVERNEMGNAVWSDYLDYIYESEELTPCVIINAHRRKSEDDISNFCYVPNPHSEDWPQLLDRLLRQSLAGHDPA